MAVADEAPLLNEEEDHPQEVATEIGGVRVVLIDSARYCDARNAGDIVIAASYGGVLPARLMAPHRPRAAILHDVNIAKDGSGISGLYYLEALGIPAATVDGATAELGNSRDMFEAGRISRVNVLAERCGVTPGVSVAEACQRFATREPGDTTPKTKVRREVKETQADGRSIVVTDSIVFALPEDHGTNVLVTAGHTGKTGARFLEEVSPWGFVCADGGGAKNDSGTSGLAAAETAGLAGACYDVRTAAMGDAFDAWDHGRISACNQLARRRGVFVGQSVQHAARCLLGGSGSEIGGPPAAHGGLASPLLRSGRLAGISPKFAEGLARVREVTDLDGALPASTKALFMAAAASVKGHDAMLRRELVRAVAGGLTVDAARGAGISVLISRGEAVFERFMAAVDEVFGGLGEGTAAVESAAGIEQPRFDASAETAVEYFQRYFGFVPPYIELMAELAPRALEGYFLMREYALAENLLAPKYVELLLCTVNAAEFSSRFVDVHAGGARRAGATEAEIVEAVVCAIPVAGVASWLPGADGVALGRPQPPPEPEPQPQPGPVPTSGE